MVDDVSPTESDDKPVPNLFPKIQNVPYRLAIIGEAPGADECREGKPFVGASGRFLSSLLSRAGIVRDACFIGNICQHRPPGNNIDLFAKDGPQFTHGLAQLKQDLEAFKPNICLLLGKTALAAAKGTYAISDWRGSLFEGTVSPFLARKCLASYHPAACLRQYDWTPLLMFDIKKVLTEATSSNLALPDRILEVSPTLDSLLRDLDRVLTDKPKVAIDLEGGTDIMPCLSIATSETYSFIVPFTLQKDAVNRWSVDEEMEIWKRLSAIMADPEIHKVFQFGLFDRFIFQYSYQMITRGTTDDTIPKHWELYCELDKDLGFQTSLYTKEPFYKDEISSGNVLTFYRYCCKDSAVTLEICNKLDKWLDPKAREHYQLNMVLINLFLYMELRGIRYDSETAKARKEEVNNRIYELQADLDLAAGPAFGVSASEPKDLIPLVQNKLCYKNDKSRPLAFAKAVYPQAIELAKKGNLTKHERGFLSVALKLSMNIRSPVFKKFLYETKQFPKQFKPATKKSEEPKLTTDFEAILKLKKLSKDPVLDYALGLTMHRTRAQMLSVFPASDGRMRCTYNPVGSETGRVSSSRSAIKIEGLKKKRVGTNLQTVSDDWEIEDEDLVLLTEGLRGLYLADKGHYLAQMDLRGADGWTIGARMASLGDSTMFDDLLAGLKPAQIVCFILRHGYGQLARASRPEIKELLKEVKKEDWDYYVCKQVIWGTCYLMGPRKAAEQIFKESYGKVNLTEKEAREFQAAVFVRYKVKTWHDWMTRHLAKQPYPPKLVAPSGQTRRFFSRQRDILGEALAHEPQVNTTYATNMAAYRLWTDRENRLGNKLRVEPLHQVHDALIAQFKIEDTDWAIGKIKQWFDNPIEIGGIKVTIPFEGTYGLNWAFDDKSKIGAI